MPRPLRFEVEQPPPKARALVASATNFQRPNKIASTAGGGPQVKAEQWNKLAWEFFDTIAEYRYAVEWVGNLLSRAKLIILQNGEPTEDAHAVEILGELGGGEDGQAELLRQFGIHFTVTGDSYLVAVDEGDETDWFVAAASETRRADADGDWMIGQERFPSSKIMVIRLWRPHPQKRWLADAPTRPSLPILSEIDGLTKHVAAQIDSRLAGAGILFVPNDMAFGAPPSDGGPGDDQDPPEQISQPDELVQVMIDAASSAMTDRQHPASLVPIVIQADGDAIKNVRHITFWSELNAAAKDLRSEAIRRLALGMDMPPEVLTGTGSMNHWSSWQIEEAAIKAHTEPLLAVIVNALTRGYLRPLLEEAGVDDVDTFEFGVDTTALRLRPNRSKEAVELWDRGELAGAVMIRENGFDPESEMMDDKERASWFLRQIAKQTATPNITLAALRELGVPGLDLIPVDPTRITVTEREMLDPNSPIDHNPTGDQPKSGAPEVVTPATPKAGREAVPSLKGHPSRSIPAPKQAAGLEAAAGVMVYRALERAGNKIKSRLGGKIPGVRAADLYRSVKLDFAQHSMDLLLDDAWGSMVDEFAAVHDVDPKWLAATLDTYTRDLLQYGKPFDQAALNAHLALADGAR